MKRSLIFDADVQLARAIADGLACMTCQEDFVEAHGEPVACHFCWSRLTPVKQGRIRRAWLEESKVNGIRRVNRAKKHRASKWAGLAITTTRNDQ